MPTTIKFKFECPVTKDIFEAPHLSDFAYGEFILFSKTKPNCWVYFNSFEDGIFEELELLVTKCALFSKVKNKPETFQMLIGHITDSIVDRGDFQIDQMPICPCHEKTSSDCLGPKEPPEIIEVPSATFNKWQSLSENEKLKVIDNFISLHGETI